MRTSPASSDTTNTSSIDQRPMTSTMRYSRVRSVAPSALRRCAMTAISMQCAELEQRHEEAGDEDGGRQRPVSGHPEVDHAAQDRVLLGSEQRLGGHHRQHVGREVKHGGGNQQCPGPAEAVGFARVQSRAAAAAGLARRRIPPDGIAMVAADHAQFAGRVQTDVAHRGHGMVAPAWKPALPSHRQAGVERQNGGQQECQRSRKPTGRCPGPRSRCWRA